MKKIALFLLSVVLLTNITLNVKGYEEDLEVIVKNTNEPKMPMVTTSNMLSVNDNLLKNQREQWLEQVVEINENAYEQQVVSAYETIEYFILEFEPNPEKIDQTVKINANEYENVQIDKILYLKPETKETFNVLNSDDMVLPNALAPSDPGTGSNTKIVEYYGWAKTNVEYSKKTGILRSIVDTTIGLFAGSNVAVGWILSQTMGAVYDTIDALDNVTAKVYHKYYYRNKVGCVYSNTANSWLSIAFVGERRTFVIMKGYIYDEAGQPTEYVKNKKGVPTNNPTNYDNREKKNHYDDNEWIMNKAIETQTTGGYYDCFMSVSNKD